MDRKQQIMKLWTRCFNDSEAFIHLFFDKVYKEENALVIEQNGKVVSALQMLPYTMTYYGTEISVSYIYGACTAPEARNQGLMRQLLHHAFDIMKQRDVAVTVLIPAELWLFDYYRKQGYTETFDYATAIYTCPDHFIQEPAITITSLQGTPTPALYHFFDRKIRERSCCILHTYNDFITILRDIEQEKGELLTALDTEGNPVGMLFLSTSTEGKRTVRELLYDNETIQTLLLQKATVQNRLSQLSYITTPATSNNTFPLGMARIIDTDRLIHHWLSQHPNAAFSRNDLENMDIRLLTHILFGYSNKEAYMSLMLN